MCRARHDNPAHATRHTTVPRALPIYLIKVPHEVDAFFPRTLWKRGRA